jgi:hypothetical protein
MSADQKELAEIKGYVSRLYQIIRSRTESALELTVEQNEDVSTVGDTIEDINTKLQIANSFQQEEIYDTIQNLEKLLKQLLNVEAEKFTDVGSWMNLKINTSFGGPLAVFFGDLLGYVISESDKSINIKEIYSVITYQGHTFRKMGFEPFAKMLDMEQEININKKSLLYITKPSKIKLENFNLYKKTYSEYKDVRTPWNF